MRQGKGENRGETEIEKAPVALNDTADVHQVAEDRRTDEGELE